ncbi:unnamed protein product [Mytilus coruscus]|uniref:C2H2-type domain-containing protein n=1 Tax=Mytilus coruscus TaxID=42192 RepID=A0A6J8D3Z3_MYTCO|nr:unnamed protein product [Mytilus coruscus]
METSRFSTTGTAQSCVIVDVRELALEQPLQGSGVDNTCNTIRRLPSILITHGFCFLDGTRIEWAKLPSWLANDDIGDITESEPLSMLPNTRENEPTREVQIGDDNTAYIIVPFHRSTCTKCKETFIQAKDMAKHFEAKHSDVFLSFQCAACGTNRNRYRQTACHYPKCRKRLSKKGDTIMTTHEGELRQADPSPLADSLSTISPSKDPAEPNSNTSGGDAAPLAPDTEQAEAASHTSTVEAVRPMTEITGKQFPCTLCERNFKTKIGLGQHERYAHPDLRNNNRIENVKADIERKQVNRKRKVTADSDAEPKSKTRGIWSEEEVTKLLALCEELKGTKNINKAIALHLPGKTNKQISDKRRNLTAVCKSKQAKVEEPKVTAARKPTKPTQREQLTPQALVNEYKDEVCDKGAEETVGESAKILRSVLSGADPGAIQFELLRFIIDKCKKPEKDSDVPPNMPPDDQPKSRRQQKKPDEFRRVQSLFDRNRKQLAAEILDRKAEAAKCNIDPKVVADTYQARFGGESQKVDLSKYPLPKPANNQLLLKPFTRVEVTKAVKRAKRDSAAGPDGIALDDLKSIDKSNAMITNIYNVWLFTSSSKHNKGES